MDSRYTEAGAGDEFRAMLVDLSDRVDECGLEMMKFYCKPHVARMRLEVITKSIHLWEALEERGLLSSNDTSLLRELFEKAIKRNDLLKIVIDYDQRNRNRPAQSTAVSSLDSGFRAQLQFVADNINLMKWRKFVRGLGLSDSDIDNVVDRYRSDVREQIFQALLMWATRSGVRANRDSLVGGLHRSQSKLIADQLADQFPV